ncbi:DUF3147 family protein [Altererythrobacter aquiaggeris]|uniref:DUF3147 family protein n=1 Tax=Aestuarierythrobacter aquiaggeris TaxID=1898396 RepID=UPI0030161ADB
MQLVIKALISGVLVAIASEVARRSPGFGGLLVSLPVVSTLALIWLWNDSGGDSSKVADMAIASSIYVTGSLPAFLTLAMLLRRGTGFPASLAIAAVVAMLGYLGVSMIGSRLGWPV